MKIIRITTDNEISTHEFPVERILLVDSQLQDLIGPKCNYMEHIMPQRLYKVLGASNKPNRELGSCTGMLMDEDACYHHLEVNLVASWLYESDIHGHPIMGNVLIIGEYWENDGVELCGMSDEQYNLLYPQLEELTKEAKLHCKKNGNDI